MSRDTVTIWLTEGRESLIDELDDRVDNRNQALLEAIDLFLTTDDILGDEELWADAEPHERRSMLRQALIDYRRDYLSD